MWIVAATALRAVRIIVRHEHAEAIAHGMTPKALLLPGNQCGSRRVDRIRLAGLHGELVAHDAMQIRLLRHCSELYPYGVVASGLGAGFAHRLEPVDLLAVAGGALHPRHDRRPRVQVHLVARRG
jgi:hypothetical protein